MPAVTPSHKAVQKHSLLLNPTTTTPGAGEYARIIGYVVDSDTIYFDPSKVWVDIPSS